LGRRGRTGLLPVHEQETSRRVELRLARPREDLELKLFDRIPRTVPAGERPVPRPTSAREQHHVHLGIVGHQTVVTIEMPDGPECHLAVDGGDQRSVNLGIPVVIESHDHASEPRMMRDILCLYPIQPEPPMASVFRNESRVTIHRVTAWAEIPGGEAESP